MPIGNLNNLDQLSSALGDINNIAGESIRLIRNYRVAADLITLTSDQKSQGVEELHDLMIKLNDAVTEATTAYTSKEAITEEEPTQ